MIDRDTWRLENLTIRYSEAWQWRILKDLLITGRERVYIAVLECTLAILSSQTLFLAYELRQKLFWMADMRWFLSNTL